jgi:hypothetical protein
VPRRKRQQWCDETAYLGLAVIERALPGTLMKACRIATGADPKPTI